MCDSSNEIQQKLSDRLYEGMIEPRVRKWIIDPYLRDVLNRHVMNTPPEFDVHSSNGKSVDYALLSNSKAEILVEVKALDVNIQKVRGQLSEYLDLSGVDYGLLTNGRDFEIMERNSNTENEIINRFNLGDDPPEMLISSKKMDTNKYKNTKSFSKKLSANIPQFIDGSIVDILTLQYHSDRMQIDPLHIYLSVDENLSKEIRTLFLDTYDNILYGKSYKNKDLELIENSKSPRIIVYDNINSDYDISSFTLKNAFDSIIFNEKTEMPNNIPILILNSPNEGLWNEYDPVEEQLNINNNVRSDIDLIHTIEDPDVESDDFDNVINDKIGLDSSNNLSTSFEIKDYSDLDIKDIKTTTKTKNNIKSRIRDIYNNISRKNEHININNITKFNKISKLVAHLSNSNSIKEEHLDISENIMISYLKDVGHYKTELETFDADMTNIDESNSSSSSNDRREKLRDVISENKHKGEKGVPKDTVLDIMSEDYNYDESDIRYDLQKLVRTGDKLYEPKPDEFALI